MNDTKYLKDIQIVIEKIIDNRINEIIKNTDFDENINNILKVINNNISNSDNTIKKQKNIKKKSQLTSRNLFIKEAFRIAKNEPHLNYLPNDMIVKIKSFNTIKTTEKMKIYNDLWKKLDNDLIIKYNKLCEKKDFTSDKYLDIINKMKHENHNIIINSENI